MLTFLECSFSKSKTLPSVDLSFESWLLKLASQYNFIPRSCNGPSFVNVKTVGSNLAFSASRLAYFKSLILALIMLVESWLTSKAKSDLVKKQPTVIL